jgi:EpsI family protein
MIRTHRFIIVYLLLALTALYLQFHRDDPTPMNKPFAEFPRLIADWKTTSETTMAANVLNVLKPTDYLSRQYVDKSGRSIGLYIGYHDGGKETGEIHSPKHCLPGSGWAVVSGARSELTVGNERIKLASAVYRKGEEKELFLYWFQVRGVTMSEEFSLKWAEIVNSLLHGRQEATFVRISVPVAGNEQEARSAGERFIRNIYPLLNQFLPA